MSYVSIVNITSMTLNILTSGSQVLPVFSGGTTTPQFNNGMTYDSVMQEHVTN